MLKFLKSRGEEAGTVNQHCTMEAETISKNRLSVKREKKMRRSTLVIPHLMRNLLQLTHLTERLRVKPAMTTLVLTIAFAVWSMSSFAQVQTLYVVKSGSAIPVSSIENVIFNGATAGDTLFVYKNNGLSVDKISLDNIQQLTFSSENLSVETLSGSEVYALKDIAKLTFKDAGSTGINSSVHGGFDVLVYVNSAGDVVVESPVGIKSLTLFSIEGKMISTQYCEVETQCIASLRDIAVGVYLLHVETEQGIVVKKVVKPLKK